MSLLKNSFYDIYLPPSCFNCKFENYENILEVIFMGAILPAILVNLVLYILIAWALHNRRSRSNSARDNTLSRAFLLLSVSWMILWLPLIAFRILFGFLEAPSQDDLFDWGRFDYKFHERYYLAEFVVVQISLFFSTLNSFILIIVLRPFHQPLLTIVSKMKQCFCASAQR